MSIDSVRQGLQTLQLGIPGITTAYNQLPRGVINAVDLPLFLNFVRVGDYDYEAGGSDVVQLTRTYPMWLLVKPAAEGEEGEGESLVEPWIDVVTNYFNARPSLGHIDGILTSYIVTDSGPKKMIWPGTPTNPVGIYWGCEFQLRVVERFARIYAENE